MARRVAAANQKGGVGKTTSVVSLAIALVDMGKRVAICDFDTQSNTCMSFGIDPDNLDKTFYDVFIGEADIQDVIIKTEFGVDIIPPGDELSSMDVIIIENKEIFERPAHILHEELMKIDDQYDYIFIDLPPSLSLLTVNGLTACTDVIIAMQCEYLATRGVLKLLNTIEKVKKNYNPDLNILGILGTMFLAGTNLSTVILQEARKFAAKKGIRMFETVISRAVKVGEAPMYGIPTIRYNPDNKAVQDYIALAKEVFGDDN